MFVISLRNTHFCFRWRLLFIQGDLEANESNGEKER